MFNKDNCNMPLKPTKSFQVWIVLVQQKITENCSVLPRVKPHQQIES